MPVDEILELLRLLKEHAYTGAAALVVGGIVRAVKADAMPGWAKVPARWRPLVAILLGQVAAILDAVARGTPWRDAFIGGLWAAFAAIVGHDVLIETLRGGRELGEKRDTDSEEEGVGGKLKKLLKLVGIGVFVATFAGCGYGKTACTVVDVAHDVCTVVRYLAPDGSTREVRMPASQIASFAEAYADGRAGDFEPQECPQ